MAFLPLKSKSIYIDESGDPNIRKINLGASDYYVITAVIVDSDLLEEETKKLCRIIKRYFPSGELKSNKVGGKIIRRRKILEEIASLEFKQYSQVIDKSKIHSDSGLGFSRSFIKYVNRTVYKQLFEAFSNMRLIADEQRKSEFMDSFSRYIMKKIPTSLFDSASFEYGNSKDHPFIQVADMIAGTISRVYVGKDSIEILETLRSKTIIIDEWPPRLPLPIGADSICESEKYNYFVRNQALQYANRFLEENTNSKEKEINAQVAAVRYLIYHFRSVDPEEYITCSIIRNHLIELGFPMSDRVFRSRVIGKLREKGVVIASGKHGIKIPYSVADLREFVYRVNSQVVPYIERLKQSRKKYLLASEGKLDIVNRSDFPELYKYVCNDKVID